MAEKNFKIIKGKKFDRSILDKAEKSLKSKGNSGIPILEAKKIISLVKIGTDNTETEKRTIRYIRDNFKFTKEADQFFRKEIGKWATKKDPGKKFAITRNPKDTKQKKSLGPIAHTGISKRVGRGKAPAKVTKSSSVRLPSAKAKIAPLSEISAKISLPGSIPEVIKPVSTSRNMRYGIGLIVLVILAVLAFLYKHYSTDDSKEKAAISDGKNINSATTDKKIEKSDLEQNKKTPQPEKMDKTEIVKNNKIIKPAGIPKKSQPSDTKEFTNYTVKSGDQLSTISKKFLGDYALWQKIYDLNRKIIQDPNLIYPSQVIKIPK